MHSEREGGRGRTRKFQRDRESQRMRRVERERVRE
jgi:hypothetical protein